MLEEVEKIATILLNAIKNEFVAQGHHLTGKTESQLTYEIKEEINSIVILGYGPDYVKRLNQGVPASQIPTSSDYIRELIIYAAKRFNISGKEAARAGYFIAKAHQKFGMPTPNSFKFSTTGQRTGFIDIALEKQQPFLDREFNKIFTSLFNFQINNLIAKYANNGVQTA